MVVSFGKTEEYSVAWEHDGGFHASDEASSVEEH